jgi:hypothetical protein
MNLPKRLRRQLSFANVIACVALFVALGGGAYAATNINGNSIVKESIGGGKLKKETITSKQIKKGTLNSSVIDVSSLTTVPSAQTAVTANSATTANSAATASKADSANTATKANSADSAGHADNADFAETADHATTAGDAATLGGKTAADLTDACRPETELFGGMCWDEDEQQARGWVPATLECAARGGRLPSISELVAYVLQPGIQVGGENWSGDLDGITVGNKEVVLTSDETTRRTDDTTGGITLPYRCLFYQTNG